jgi:hypothetical protein
MQWLAVRHGADQFSFAEPKLKPDYGLLFLVLSEFGDEACGQSYGAPAALCLQGRDADRVTNSTDCLCDIQLVVGPQILPPQPANLAPPKAGLDG